MRGLFAELKRRRIFRAAFTYAAAAWAVLQVADIFFPLMGLPEWSMTLVLMLSATGFPVAMIMAWVFDLSYRGVELTDKQAPENVTVTFSFYSILQLSLTLVLIATVAYLYYERLVEPASNAVESPVTPAPLAHSIAVLPFEDLSPDGDNRYFGDGIAEELLNALAQLKDLQVAARTSSFSLRDSGDDALTIGVKLKVASLLEGSVRKDGDNVRITAQLIDTSNGFHLWSKTYDSKLEDIFSLQDDIARQVVDAILPMLSGEIRYPKGPTTSNVTAYNEYLKGRAFLREPPTDDVLDNAEQKFRRAVELDPKYAEAWAGLCDALLADYRHNNRSNQQKYLEGEQACGVALTRSTSNQFSLDVYLALGVLYREASEYEKSLESLLKGKQISPESVRLLKELGITYAAASAVGGDTPREYSRKAQEYLGKAEQHLKKAVDLNVGSWASHLALANFYFDTGDYARAVLEYERVLELHPGAIDALINKASSLNWMGEEKEAEAIWRLAIEQALATKNNGPLGFVYLDLGGLYYYQGEAEKALDMYRAAEQLRPRDHVVLGRLAESYRAMGNHSQELALYGEAIGLAEGALAFNPDNWHTLGLLGIYHGFSGHREQAMEYVQRMLALHSNAKDEHYFAALVYWSLGEIEKTYEQLTLAAKRPSLRKYLTGDPDLQKLRLLDERRFDAVIDSNSD